MVYVNRCLSIKYFHIFIILFLSWQFFPFFLIVSLTKPYTPLPNKSVYTTSISLFLSLKCTPTNKRGQCQLATHQVPKQMMDCWSRSTIGNTIVKMTKEAYFDWWVYTVTINYEKKVSKKENAKATNETHMLWVHATST